MAKHLRFTAAVSGKLSTSVIARSLGAPGRPRASHGEVITYTPLAFRVGRDTPVERALDVERQRREIFVSTLAHELRQPLATLLAAVEVIRVASASATTYQATAIMTRQIDQMGRVVEDLLDAARWVHGTVALRKQRLDLRDVIGDAALDVAAAAAARGHALVVATMLEPLWIDGDRQRLHQVLSNLLQNAVKYTEPGGRIELAAECGATAVTVRVSDTGCGIEAEALAHIFDLFAQVRPMDGAGLGIGLSVVREIVALHAGRIKARSDGPGRGSEFSVTLPLAPPPVSLITTSA